MYLQPKVELESGRIMGLEALTEMPVDCLKLDRSFLLHNFHLVLNDKVITAVEKLYSLDSFLAAS